ncbi:MAG: hypothetical protein ACI9EX_000811 [Oleispira sp.]|jgi:hypothetical protein
MDDPQRKLNSNIPFIPTMPYYSCTVTLLYVLSFIDTVLLVYSHSQTVITYTLSSPFSRKYLRVLS